MKYPSKPRAPSKVTRPTKLLPKGKKVGSLSSWAKGMSPTEAFEKTVEKASAKLGIPIEELDSNQIYLNRMQFVIFGLLAGPIQTTRDNKLGMRKA